MKKVAVAAKVPAAPGKGAELAAVLASLVTKGTITQVQADAITAALTAAHAANAFIDDGASRATDRHCQHNAAAAA